ncbi:MAG TPA: aldehyde dehydrogenase family protein [Caulobacteraceae bacterium]|jgi:glutamate-5-semialdehyde dehydrogenase
MSCEALTSLAAGMPIPFGGDKLARVSPELAAAFRAGDRLIVVQETGELLHVPAATHALAAEAVARAAGAFAAMNAVSDDAIGAFFAAFAAALANDDVWARIAAANVEDVASATARGRSTTRLATSARMRADMIAGLEGWRDAAPSRGRAVETVEHEGWAVEQVTAPLGVVGFVFEGRPNVFADAAGVLRGGNAAVFRIGSDALGTARAIMAHALAPALAKAGLPEGACVLLESAEHAAGWAMFSDARLGLAVARGSGRAVAQLGAVARQAGVPVSLHGTGGAWLVADGTVDAARFEAIVRNSLDRKVCNTLNVCCIVRGAAATLVPAFLAGLDAAGKAGGHGCKLHVAAGDEAVLPADWRNARTRVRRAEGDGDEPLVEVIDTAALGREWEWEATPEVSLKLVDDVAEAVALFNRLSPRLTASLVSADAAAQRRFYAEIDAPFVGDGMTRWVDGQYALGRPELGLSNWEHGRLLGRSAVLSGDSVHTVRTRMTQKDADLHR